MNQSIIAQSSPPSAPAPSVPIPLELIVVVGVSGMFSLLTGMISWLALSLLKNHQERMKKLEVDVDTAKDKNHSLEVEIKTNYLHVDEFYRQSMISTHQLEILAGKIDNLATAVAKS